MGPVGARIGRLASRPTVSRDPGEYGKPPLSRQSAQLPQGYGRQGVNWRAETFRGKFLAPQVGLEPTTLRLTAECSTIELLRSNVGGHPLLHQTALLKSIFCSGVGIAVRKALARRLTWNGYAPAKFETWLPCGGEGKPRSNSSGVFRKPSMTRTLSSRT